MKISQAGINLIKSFEGCRLEAYKPVKTEKYWTIGYGHYGSDVKEGSTITQKEADELLKFDLRVYDYAVNNLVKVPVTQNQFDSLVSFTYNCGRDALRTSTLLKKLNNKDYVGAANEFEKWVNAGGQVLRGLVTRRKAEKTLFLKEMKEEPKKETSNHVNYPNEVFKKGSRGRYVGMIQISLNHAIGKKVVQVDEKFGEETEKAVRDYQKRHELKIDGQVGKQTWNTLF